MVLYMACNWATQLLQLTITDHPKDKMDDVSSLIETVVALEEKATLHDKAKEQLDIDFHIVMREKKQLDQRILELIRAGSTTGDRALDYQLQCKGYYTVDDTYYRVARFIDRINTHPGELILYNDTLGLIPNNPLISIVYPPAHTYAPCLRVAIVTSEVKSDEWDDGDSGRHVACA